ncbi:MAG: hypothetical protein ACRDMV_07415 [Streptosporangiales bacterium]
MENALTKALDPERTMCPSLADTVNASEAEPEPLLFEDQPMRKSRSQPGDRGPRGLGPRIIPQWCGSGVGRWEDEEDDRKSNADTSKRLSSK